MDCCFEKEKISCGDMQVVILMGGLGTRLKDRTSNCPKPLVSVCGKPFFEYELEVLLLSGFRKFVFLIGYKGSMVEEYFGDGSRYGADVKIVYSYDGETLLGTGGAVIKALPLLEDDFLLLYADSFMDVDFFEIIYRYFLGKAHGRKALMTVIENHNRYDKSNVVYMDGQIQEYDKKNRAPNMSYIDYGIEVFSKDVFLGYPEKPVDLSDIQQGLVHSGLCSSCEVTRRFYEIGTPEALQEFQIYVKDRLCKPRNVCFIDRDGVINEIVFNEDAEQMDSPLSIEQFQFMQGAEAGLKKLLDMDFDIFIVTNQPAAAKGKVSLAQIYDINTYMVKELQKAGIVVSGVCVCPHHPNGSKRTKERFLIRECSCRKPKPGMILNIIKKYNVDIKRSYMLGDSYTDMIAGREAGVKTVFIGDYKCDSCRRLNGVKPVHIVKNILLAAEQIEKDMKKYYEKERE